jgi:hypothetical protein
MYVELETGPGIKMDFGGKQPDPVHLYAFIVSKPNSLYLWKLLNIPLPLRISRNIYLEGSYNLQ